MHSSLHVEDMDLRGNSSAHLSLQQVGRTLQQCFAVPQSLRLRTPSRLTLSKPIMILLQKVCLEESTWNYDSEFIFEGTWIWKAPKKSKTVILMSSQSILIILRYTK